MVNKVKDLIEVVKRFMKILLFAIVLVCVFLLNSDVRSENTKCDKCDESIFTYKTPAPDPFILEAPHGWVRDTRAGSSQGLYQVFYPEGKSWGKSPVVAYGRYRIKTDNTKTIEDQIADTIKDFQDNGSPNIKAEFKESIKLPSGEEAKMYFYTGDRFGNYEAASYIEEAETINFVVMSAKNESEFNNAINKYYELVKSYTIVNHNK